MGTEGRNEGTDVSGERTAKGQGARQPADEKRYTGDTEYGPDTGSISGRLKDDLWKLQFEIGRSIRYWAKLETRYAKLENWTTLLNLAGGSAVIIDVLSGVPIASKIGAVIILITGMSSMVFGWGAKGRFANQQRQTYTLLDAEIEKAIPHITVEILADFKGRYVEIEKHESATKNTLMRECFNEECTAKGVPDDIKTIPLYKWPFTYW